jgi:uncharacterized protein
MRFEMPQRDRLGRSLKRDLVLLGLVSAPFFLNDFAFMAMETAPRWLAADYGSKILALVILFSMAPLRQAVAGTVALPRATYEAAALTVVAAALIIGADWLLRGPIDIEIESWVLFKYPKLDSAVLYWTDVTFGLALTAVSEELVFRGLFARLMAPVIPGAVAMTVASAVFFALIHWSHGVTSLVVAFLAGLALMALYRRTGSLLTAMAAHYLVNLWDFV